MTQTPPTTISLTNDKAVAIRISEIDKVIVVNDSSWHLKLHNLKTKLALRQYVHKSEKAQSRTNPSKLDTTQLKNETALLTMTPARFSVTDNGIDGLQLPHIFRFGAPQNSPTNRDGRFS